ncbi:glycoside hydrolase family 3 protein [Nesterenkonia xinjiangensis]|uniref:beta-N-acetylhexosaminidase n=1 Tax=Nesterenkonia xinjiangensis TaxID=225327 RepID=A0A7Z0GJV7_9MICC|nr:glycoside hydrolase family 3 N-terminal domain-containing protein [Nesterenkonia xinjiangensis]NYJ77339.1 beta-N-acetylhexosaminidase [Nesterenkonia xinjiangensis]
MATPSSAVLSARRRRILPRHRIVSLRGVLPLLLVPAVLLSACGPAGTDDDDGAHDDGAGDTEGGAETGGEQDEQDRLARERQEAHEARQAALAGPGERHREAASLAAAELSTEEQAGQVLVGEYGSTDASSMASAIEELHLAGAIVMGDNVPRSGSEADLEALSGQLESLQDAASAREWPAVVAVDQEGGLVTRVGDPLTEWPSPMAYGAAHLGALAEERDGVTGQEDTLAGYDELAALGHEAMGADLAQLGFTVDFAPNADVTIGDQDAAIGSRSFGDGPEQVADLALAGLRGLAEGGVAGSAKHFPGHGGVTEDSHHTLPEQAADREELTARDWAPFQHVIDAGAPMIMMGHLDVPALEPGVPSSLSAASYSELREMGHEGVIVTDALNMAAVVQHAGPAEAPVQALEAGADLLLMPSDVRTAHQAIVDAVESGRVGQDRLTEAAERVIALMLWQRDLAAGELDAGPGVVLPEALEEADLGGEATYAELPEPAADGALESAEVARAVAERSITLVSGRCEAGVLEDPISVDGGQEADRTRLATALEDSGHTLGDGGTTIRLIAPGAWGSDGDVVVTLDRPEPLALAPGETQVALYGRTPESFEALVDVLDGAPAPGALPVQVGELEAGHSAC